MSDFFAKLFGSYYLFAFILCVNSTQKSMDNQLPIYKIVFDEDLDKGVTAISLVDYPAIESDFLHFAKEEPQQMWRFANEEKREIVGAVLIPDKLIYRRIGDFEFFVTFSKEVIEDLAWSNFMRGFDNNFTLMHEHSDANPFHDLVSGIETIGNWIEDENYKEAKEYGFDDMKVGTWMMHLKVKNEDVWKQVKDNNLRGFSVELWASIEPLIMSKQNKQ